MEKKIYHIDSLPKHVEDKVLEHFREYFVVDNWYENAYENFTEKMRKIGVTVDKLMFSMSWSQGDGACYEGHVNDLGSFLKSYGYKTKYKKLVKEFDKDNLGITIYHRGRDYHEQTMYFDYRDDMADDAVNQRLYAEFTECLEELLRREAKSLYTMLEEDYYYLTSDKQVLELLYANDIQYFYESGEEVVDFVPVTWGKENLTITM
jgi:hypothetical protein